MAPAASSSAWSRNDAGALVDLGAATLTYGVAAGIVVAAALIGTPWGIPAHMGVEPEL